METQALANKRRPLHAHKCHKCRAHVTSEIPRNSLEKTAHSSHVEAKLRSQEPSGHRQFPRPTSTRAPLLKCWERQSSGSDKTLRC